MLNKLAVPVALDFSIKSPLFAMVPELVKTLPSFTFNVIPIGMFNVVPAAIVAPVAIVVLAPKVSWLVVPAMVSVLTVKAWLFNVSPLSLFMVKLLIAGAAGVNVFAGMTKAEPAVFEAVPKIKLFVLATLILPPLAVLTIGVFPF